MMVWDGRKSVRTAGGSGGQPVTTRVMSHSFGLAGTEGPSTKTLVPYSLFGPYEPKCSRF